MNIGIHPNSVRKNNFLSLMKSYERNYYLLKEMIDFRILNKDNISKRQLLQYILAKIKTIIKNENHF